MNPQITIENAAGDLLHVQLDLQRVRDMLNSPVWMQFLLEEFLTCNAISHVQAVEILPLGPELTVKWLETEGNEFVNPPLDWEFEQRLADALQFAEHPLIRIEAEVDRQAIRRCLNDWMGDSHGPMVVGTQKVEAAQRMDASVDMTLF